MNLSDEDLDRIKSCSGECREWYAPYRRHAPECQFEDIDNLKSEVRRLRKPDDLARAWEEGAQAGWSYSCEGENGEYVLGFGTHDGTVLFREVAPEVPNPYRHDTGEAS